MLNKKETVILRRILGWQIGDKCAVQLRTKKAYGIIKDIRTAHVLKGIRGDILFAAVAQGKKLPKPKGRPHNDYKYAVVEYETKSKIPHRQHIQFRDLLEDDR